MLKNDEWIIETAHYGMIVPFVPHQIRKVDSGAGLGELPVISYGVSSYGYDIRLSPTDFRIFKRIPGTVVNPKAFNPENLEPAPLHSDEYGSYFILPANSYGLGVSLERVAMPENVMALCVGKSTYARAGIIANLTPIEAGWSGYVTLEFSNSSNTDCRIYANEGVVQLVFFEGMPCRVPYSTRAQGGKYQNQGQEVTLARV